MTDRIEVTCPCCDTRLTVDVETGAILAEERSKANLAKSFDQAFDDVRSGSKRREDAFAKAVDRTRQLDDVLAKKFEEAKKKAAKEKGRPRGPFDLD